MLTKLGNLAGLQNLKQSQLNLGVIQSLAADVFNTDNCTVVENANGVSFRHPQGLQICIATRLETLQMTLADGALFRTAAGVPWQYPQPFSDRSIALASVSFFSTGESRIWIPAVSTGQASVNFRAVCPVNRVDSNVSIHFLSAGRWK